MKSGQDESTEQENSNARSSSTSDIKDNVMTNTENLERAVRTYTTTCGTNQINNHGTNSKAVGSPVIMMMQYAWTSGACVGVLWDSASGANYCTFRIAKKLNLPGQPYTLISVVLAD